jgi:ribonuclease R
LKLFLSSLGLTLKGNSESIHPKALNDILTKVEDTNSEHVVNTVVLRSMRKAFYGTQCLGHFGLGVDYYCHFTAPIRRYPDLIIHRIIKETLKGKLHGNRIKSLDKLTEEASDIASKTERIAEELEREVEKLKKAEYISYHIGEEFDGIISGVQNFGFFVVIENTIEGLVRVDSLHDDYYIYEEAKYRLIGEMTHKTYRIGDSVRIRVQSVDIQCREIEFVMA